MEFGGWISRNRNCLCHRFPERNLARTSSCACRSEIANNSALQGCMKFRRFVCFPTCLLGRDSGPANREFPYTPLAAEEVYGRLRAQHGVCRQRRVPACGKKAPVQFRKE